MVVRLYRTGGEIDDTPGSVAFQVVGVWISCAGEGWSPGAWGDSGLRRNDG